MKKQVKRERLNGKNNNEVSTNVAASDDQQIHVTQFLPLHRCSFRINVLPLDSIQASTQREAQSRSCK